MANLDGDGDVAPLYRSTVGSEEDDTRNPLLAQDNASVRRWLELQDPSHFERSPLLRIWVFQQTNLSLSSYQDPVARP